MSVSSCELPSCPRHSTSPLKSSPERQQALDTFRDIEQSKRFDFGFASSSWMTKRKNMQEDGDSGEKDDINIEENEKEEETGLTVVWEPLLNLPCLFPDTNIILGRSCYR